MSDKLVPAMIVHGGAWDIPEHLAEASIKGVRRAVEEGYQILCAGGRAIDAVQAAVCVLEDDPAFDAGTGSVFTNAGEIQMDAILMDGKQLKSGAVACVENVKNPIKLAREVMDKTDHVLLAGSGAKKFAIECGIPLVTNEELTTDEAKREFKVFSEYTTAVHTLFKHRGETLGHDTVGAAAVDCHGDVAFGTSTGGITGQLSGRVGDTCCIGAGGYADNDVGAASTTGHGEGIMRVCLAKHVTDLMAQGLSCQEACEKALAYMDSRIGSAGGVIAVSPRGELGHAFTTDRMAWASVKQNVLHYGLNPDEDNVVRLNV